MIVNAVYKESFGSYKGNPFIEALPEILEPRQVVRSIKSKIDFNQSDCQASSSVRAHLISQMMGQFFYPITRHIDLEKKLSIMIRQGYVGRNLKDGSLNARLQNGYERLMSGKDDVIEFPQVNSTALSLAFIGCSGSGKTTTLNKILSTYPQVIYHPKFNFTQIVYLRVDCPHDGSLKSLCLHFFRAIDQALDSNYEQKYALKRHSVETLLNLMRQISNHHAIGLLVIDEIQHLSVNKSGGAEKMLNFFVTLVNTVGLPVVMVGTPKARFIFEGDFRSARRGAGFGSIFWEQLAKESNFTQDDGTLRKSEWNKLTDHLWKYQWLRKADLTLSEDIRDRWYELSQGVLDIVVKLYVLAQLRAIDSGLERITVKLLQNTYEEDLKPIHPMIEALQSGRADRIAQFSDLVVPDIDKKLLQLQSKLDQKRDEFDEVLEYQGHELSIRLHRMLVDLGQESPLLVPTVKKAVAELPEATIADLITIILDWLKEAKLDLDNNETKSASKTKVSTRKTKSVKQKDWHTLDSDDLRFQFSQRDESETFYEHLKTNTSLIFDVDDWLPKAG
ncbi:MULTISPECIES: AAA family ATPase [Psychrobacter]|uniref:Transposon Tn7 transposition protein TnsC n=2 Tax=Psychrobacter TaxID=497 RepID=A0A1R4GWY0_9GAMM|nr:MULTISPECIES: AAA family ATPase [Psychrobacter]SJM37768.1 Transposon Tn7 transposition protein TnsC [Psychrobacter pasteurii]SJM72634.1 Transposon Tn7 transposition protein TnsC [Psychrobacter piechaudii]